MPVMEGKAMLFKELAGVDAFPLCLSTTDVDEIVRIVEGVAPTFGGINLEDIAAPRCFEIERAAEGVARHPGLPRRPARHRGRRAGGAAERAEGRRQGRVRRPRGDGRRRRGGPGLREDHPRARRPRPRRLRHRRHPAPGPRGPARASWPRWPRAPTRAGSRARADDALAGADVVVGVSAPGAFTAAGVRTMAKDAIVFAMANPTPEVQPEEVWEHVAIMATGRSDYPNQINNVLAFPGIFRGALDVRARGIDEAMKLAAARAIAGVIPESDLGPGVHHPERLQPRRRARRGRRGGQRRRSSRGSPAASVRRGRRRSRRALGGDGARGLVVDLDEAQVVVGDLGRGGLAIQLPCRGSPSARSTRSSGRWRSR